MSDNVLTFPKTPRWSGDPGASTMRIDLIEHARLEMARGIYAYRVLVGPVATGQAVLKVLESFK